jgi:ubiquinone/menaquinone biosynthesis C-methylase UbiE
MYSNPAGYESYMGRWSAKLAPHFLRFACREEPKTMVDVGCGTGTLIRAASVRFARARLVGLDPSLPYLVHAKTKTESRRAEFLAGRSEALPFADGTFDHCLSLLVLQEIEDRSHAIGEMSRVTCRNGIVAGCQWDFCEGMPVIGAVRDAIKAIAPALYESTTTGTGRAFTSLGELDQYWSAVGLEDVETARLAVTLSYANFREFWLPLLSGSTPLTEVVASLPSNARKAVRERLKLAISMGTTTARFRLQLMLLQFGGGW